MYYTYIIVTSAPPTPPPPTTPPPWTATRRPTIANRHSDRVVRVFRADGQATGRRTATGVLDPKRLCWWGQRTETAAGGARRWLDVHHVRTGRRVLSTWSGRNREQARENHCCPWSDNCHTQQRHIARWRSSVFTLSEVSIYCIVRIIPAGRLIFYFISVV